ncbi:MAG: phosphoenolpyruvate--protein phosphotransferase [Pseudomonadota bacterium]
MLDTLRHIVGQVGRARDLNAALRAIVLGVRNTLEVAVCSVYLLPYTQVGQANARLVLMANEGLAEDAVGRVSMALDEGLVGLVAQRAEPINLDDAPTHPRYKHIADIGEEAYHAFLGAPILLRGEALGVLVVQDREPRHFSDDQESFLVTLAAQLASSIVQAEISEAVAQSHSSQGRRIAPANEPLRGVPGASGVAFGSAVVVYPQADLDGVPDRQCDDAEQELARLHAARQAVRQDFAALRQGMSSRVTEEECALFDAFVMMLDSESLLQGMEKRIRAGQWAPAALRDTVHEYAAVFAGMDDDYLRQRADDVHDLGCRILEHLQDVEGLAREYPSRTILVGREITVTHLASVPEGRLAGIVSARGSSSSHVALLARALGVPAVMGASDLPIERLDARELFLDGYRGVVHVEPQGVLREALERLLGEEAQLSAELATLRDEPAITPDGACVHLYVNVGLLADMAPADNVGAEGIGLYRTEIPFQVRENFPGEDEQARVYREVLSAYAPRPAILRTLDVGGDKPLSYFPIEEDNPFLGWRGMRLTLDHPDIFLTQVRAMLMANVGLGNLRILLPMISGVGELDEALGLIGRAAQELREEGFSVGDVPVGLMIEVPSAVYQIDTLARRVDFLSVGTNDLTQYLLAVDRNNARVAPLYDSLHPAVLRAIAEIVAGGRRTARPVSVCGELAGDPLGALLLLGLGIDSLSMSAGSLPRIKRVIRSVTLEHAQRLAQQALGCERGEDVRVLLRGALRSYGLGGLVRSGEDVS